jgi:hypothetical protein
VVGSVAGPFAPDERMRAILDEHDRPLIDLMVRIAWFGPGRTLAMGNPKPGTGSG